MFDDVLSPQVTVEQREELWNLYIIMHNHSDGEGKESRGGDGGSHKGRHTVLCVVELLYCTSLNKQLELYLNGSYLCVRWLVRVLLLCV